MSAGIVASGRHGDGRRQQLSETEGEQQSEDWDRPRADRTAWRAQGPVWLGPRLGVAARVERVIQRREPGHREPTYKACCAYEMEEPMQLSGRLYEESRA